MLTDAFAYARIELFQPDHLRERCDSEEKARNVVTDFLDTFPQRMARLARAVTDGDTAGARQEAHSLKHTAQTLGADGLVWVSLNLEETAKRGKLSQTAALLSQIECEFRRIHPRLEEYLRAA